MPHCRASLSLLQEEGDSYARGGYRYCQYDPRWAATEVLIHASALNQCMHQLFPQCNGARAAVGVVELNAMVPLEDVHMNGFADR